jgi:tight adherence protein B
VLIEFLAAGAVALAVWHAVPSAGSVRMRALGGTGGTQDFDLRTWLSVRGWRERRSDPQRRFVQGLRALAAELASGSTPVIALERSAGEPPLWPRALAAAHFGEAVESGLRQDARDNPKLAQQLRQLAACWSVGVAHGSGLASSIDRLSLSVQAQFELRDVLSSELAAPRATSRMLSLLPVVGITLGYLLGADPIGWFFGSPIGASVLAAAAGLTGIGVVWSRRIVGRVDHALSQG